MQRFSLVLMSATTILDLCSLLFLSTFAQIHTSVNLKKKMVDKLDYAQVQPKCIRNVDISITKRKLVQLMSETD